MKEQLKFTVANGGYAPPSATEHAIEMGMSILLCSTDNFNGTTDESVEDYVIDPGTIQIP